jgi:hypothetical protein
VHTPSALLRERRLRSWPSPSPSFWASPSAGPSSPPSPRPGRSCGGWRSSWPAGLRLGPSHASSPSRSRSSPGLNLKRGGVLGGARLGSDESRHITMCLPCRRHLATPAWVGTPWGRPLCKRRATSVMWPQAALATPQQSPANRTSSQQSSKHLPTTG